MIRLAIIGSSLLIGSAAVAQDVKPLVQRYDDCVMAVSLGMTGERRMVAEQSFMACQTEEQAIRAYMGLTSTPRANVEAAIVRRKLALKRIIMGDPR